MTALLPPAPRPASPAGPAGGATHEVTNQVPPLVGHDVADDAALLSGLAREGAGWHAHDLHELGRRAGSAQAQRWADEANRYPPVLRTHDRTGTRIDEVEVHPSFDSLLDVAVGAGAAGAAWADPRPGAHVARAATFFTWSQVEAGHGCPVSMTYAVVPALRHAPIWPPATSRCSPAGCTPPGSPRRSASPGCWPGWG